MFASFPDRFFLWSTAGYQQIPGLHSSLCQSGRKEYLWCLSQRKESCLPLKTQELSLSGFHTISEPIYRQEIGILSFLLGLPTVWSGVIHTPIPKLSMGKGGSLTGSQKVANGSWEATNQCSPPPSLLSFLILTFFSSLLYGKFCPRAEAKHMGTYFLPLRPFKAGQGVISESNNYTNGHMLVIPRWEYRGRPWTVLLTWGGHRKLFRTVKMWAD